MWQRDVQMRSDVGVGGTDSTSAPAQVLIALQTRAAAAVAGEASYSTPTLHAAFWLLASYAQQAHDHTRATWGRGGGRAARGAKGRVSDGY